MVPWGTGDPISSGDLNTLVFLTEKPPPLSVSIGGGSMSHVFVKMKRESEGSLYARYSDSNVPYELVKCGENGR